MYYEIKFLVLLWMIHPQTKVRLRRAVRSAPWTVKRPYFDAEAKDDIRYRHVHMIQAHQVIQVPTCCGSVKRVGSRFRPEKRLTILHGLLNKRDATRAVYKQPRNAARSGSSARKNHTHLSPKPWNTRDVLRMREVQRRRKQDEKEGY